MIKQENCPFCIPSEHLWLEKWGVSSDLANKPLLQTEHLKVIPDLLPINDNFHALITTSDHRKSFAGSPELNTELRYLLELLEYRTKTPLILAEHGGNELSQKSKIQSIYHRHIHVLPGNIDAIAIICQALNLQNIAYQIEKVDFRSPLESKTILELGNQGIGYLSLHDYRKGMALIAQDHHDEFPSQITQKNLARGYSGPFYNWKEVSETSTLQSIAASRIIKTIERCREQ